MSEDDVEQTAPEEKDSGRIDKLESEIASLRQDLATMVNALNSYESYVNNRLIKLGSSSAHIIAAVTLLTETQE